MIISRKKYEELEFENNNKKSIILGLTNEIKNKNKLIGTITKDITKYKDTFNEIKFQLERNDYNNLEQKLNKIKELVSDLDDQN